VSSQTAATSARTARPRAERTWRAAPAVLLIVGWLAALPLVGDYGNPDGPSYAIVAQRWLDGAWGDAVNAYWGPLLSWLAVPLLAIGVDELLALRVVLLLGGLGCLVPLRALARQAGASDRATDLVLIATAPLLLYAASFGLYADVLMAAALLRSLELATRPGAFGDPWLLLRAGAWGGVAYLARAYAVPVVLVMLPMIAVIGWWCATRGTVRIVAALRAAALLLAGFAVVAGPWAVTLSVAEGTPTFSTSAGFNADLVAPGSAGNPFNAPGLYEPVREGGLSGWEEPSRLPIPLRSDAGEDGELGERDTGQRIELAVANGRIVVGSLLRRGAPFVALALVALAAAVASRRRPDPALLAPVAAGAVAAGGLLLIIAIERYLWFPILALVPAAAVGSDVLVAGPRRRFAQPAGAVLVVAVLATSAHGLLPRLGAHAEVADAAAVLDGEDLGRVATAESWQRTHLLCFELDCTYLGRPTATDVGSAADELRDAGVDHLVVWDGDLDAIDGLAEVVTAAGTDPGGTDGLTVLTVTDEGLAPGHRVEPG
jgi:hypothetical protein